jgi:ankyrin repeat protein
MKDEFGNTRLSLALEDEGIDDDEILRLIRKYPNDVKEKNDDGEYPIHRAWHPIRSDEVILTLLNIFPDALAQKDKWNTYPLHHACHSYSEMVVLKYLKIFPEAASKIYTSLHNDCTYPLHLVCENEELENVVLPILKLFPKAAKLKDYWGRYALQHAFCWKMPERILMKLLDANVLAVKGCDTGWNVLKLAIKAGHSETMIEILKYLTQKSQHELKNHIGVPKDLGRNGLKTYKRCNKIFQWLLLNSPTLIPVTRYVYEQQDIPSTTRKRKLSINNKR